MNKFVENIAYCAVNKFGSVKTAIVTASTIGCSMIGFVVSSILVQNESEEVFVNSSEEVNQNEED